MSPEDADFCAWLQGEPGQRLAMPLLILMAQQLHVIESDQELHSIKSTAELYDRCQETLHLVRATANLEPFLIAI